MPQPNSEFLLATRVPAKAHMLEWPRYVLIKLHKPRANEHLYGEAVPKRALRKRDRIRAPNNAHHGRGYRPGNTDKPARINP
jgi:hypothetical protein